MHTNQNQNWVYCQVNFYTEILWKNKKIKEIKDKANTVNNKEMKSDIYLDFFWHEINQTKILGQLGLQKAD